MIDGSTTSLSACALRAPINWSRAKTSNASHRSLIPILPSRRGGGRANAIERPCCLGLAYGDCDAVAVEVRPFGSHPLFGLALAAQSHGF